MKKRFLLLMLSMALTFSVYSCGKTDETEKVEEDAKEKKDKKKENKETTEEKGENVGDKEADDIEEQTTIVLDAIFDKYNIYVVDSDEKIHKIVDVREDDEESYIESVKVIDQFIYVKKSMKGDNYSYTVYDFGGEIYDIPFKSVNNYSITVGKHNNKICFAYSDFSEYQNEKFYAYEYDVKEKTIKEIPKMEQAMKEIEKSDYSYIDYYKGLIGTLEDYNGEAWFKDSNNNSLVKLNLNNMSVIETINYADKSEENAWVNWFDGKWVLYQNTDYSTPITTNRQYMYNSETGKKVLIAEGSYSKMYTVMDADANYLYMYNTKEASDKTKYVVTYDLNTGSLEDLYVETAPAGTEEYYVETGVSGAKVIGGNLYCQVVDGSVVKWALYDISKQKMKLTDEVVYEYSYAKYGQVEAAEGSSYYEGTDVISYVYYLENFILNKDIPFAQKINENLKTEFESDYESALDSMEMMQSEEYLEGATYYMSLDKKLCKVEEVGSHYLQIIYSVYDYAGGAHGFGWDEVLLYDLHTGERVTLDMLVGVDLETYKDIVAKKSVERWKNAEDYEFFDLYDPESESYMYDEFYEAVNYMSDQVVFGEDSLTISYPPYLFGPYSSGWIGVEVSYKELGIDLNK